ncbi:hypothetical protein EDB84DRAFT_1441280 [Lactarius hengduanensis]|nr:hypothetical protein EDB84DRAFT_1441280 [Lactarius hengduanensis]
MVPRHLTTTGPPFLLYPLPSLTQIPKTQIATGQWRPRHRLRNGLLLASHLTACERPTRLTCAPTLNLSLTRPPAPASVTTSPQPQYHHTRIRMRCPSTLTRHLDFAATPLDLTDPPRLPPRPHHAAATSTRPPPPPDPTTTLLPASRTSTRTGAVSTQPLPSPRRRQLPIHPALTPPHRRHFSTTCQLAASSSVILHVRSPVRQVHIPL